VVSLDEKMGEVNSADQVPDHGAYLVKVEGLVNAPIDTQFHGILQKGFPSVRHHHQDA
jgi:hypothetical protein